MRRRTWYLVGGVAVLIVLLLGLVIVLGSLRSGAPYHLTATPVDPGTVGANTTLLNASALPQRRFPYTTDALARATPSAPGRSDPYWRGPLGLKEVFSHSPFDELAALRGRAPGAVVGEDVLARHDGHTLRVGVVREVRGS